MEESTCGILPDSKSNPKTINLEFLLPLGLFIDRPTNYYVFDF